MTLRRDIPLFPDGKAKAFTLSFDDGVVQDRRFIELLKKYRLRATFNLNSGTFGHSDQYTHINVRHVKVQESEVAELYQEHEVASHTVTHPDMTTIASPMMCREVIEDRLRLETITGKMVRGFAYPMGTYNETAVNVLRQCGISYARTVCDTHSFELPKDFLVWHPTVHYNDPKLFELADSFLKNVFSTVLPVFYVWGHTYEFDHFENWDRIEQLFEMISGQEDTWYATNQQIVDYIKAVRSIEYSADGHILYNPTATAVWIGSTELPAGANTVVPLEK